MGVTKVQADVLVEFAGYCDGCHEALAPYTPAHDGVFKCSPATFGGSNGGGAGLRAVEDGRGSDYQEIVYSFKPMTPGEWEDATGTKLEEGLDPHSPNFSPPGASGRRVATGVGTGIQNWNNFYAAGGTREGGEWTESTLGDAPWAKPLKKTWDTVVDDRLWEADMVRKELRFLIRTLIKVAEQYPEVDLENMKMIRKYTGDV